RAIAILQDATEAGARLGDPQMQARIELLAASTRLLYDEWCADDVGTCERAYRVVRHGSNGNSPGFDLMLYAHVQSLQGDGAAALEHAEAAIPRLHEQTTDVMVHLFALSAQILALLQLGRFGQALEIIRSNQKLAERNGSDPWLF